MKKLFVLLAAIAMAGVFTVTSMAAEWDIYGSARMRTYSVDKSKERTGTDYSDRDLDWDIDKVLSRIGFKAQAGDLRGLIEIRPLDGSYVRHWYGAWNFGPGELLIGKTWPLANFLTSGLNYTTNGLQSFGGVGAAAVRIEQVRLTYGDFKLALLKPSHPDVSIDDFEDTDTTFPKIEARYTLGLENITLDFLGGYSTYDAVTDTDKEESVDSWLVGFQFKSTFGPAYFNGNINYGENLGNYGNTFVKPLDGKGTDAFAQGDGSSIKDNESLGYVLVAGYKVLDRLKLEAGYSAVSTEVDRSGKYEDDAQAYYIQAKISLADGVYLIPEAGVLDYEDSYVDGVKSEDGDETFAGLYWQIDF
jgi:hypothetical protein